MGNESSIPLVKPSIGVEEIDASERVLRSGWITQGPEIARFEQLFAEYLNCKFACAVSNCTTAMQMALCAVGVEAGDCVITVSHSFIATANSIRACYAEPLFIDILPGSFNMDPHKLEDFLKNETKLSNGYRVYSHLDRIAVAPSPLVRLRQLGATAERGLGRIRAILVVHQMGFPCDLEPIKRIAKEYQLPLIEDAACAVGSQLPHLTAPLLNAKVPQYVGGEGTYISCFSFHPRKLLTTGDGGMITYNDPQLDVTFRRMRHHGMSVSDLDRHKSTRLIVESYPESGFNYRLTDVQAGIGIAQLAKLPHQIRAREVLVELYREKLAPLEMGTIPENTPGRPNWQSLPLVLTEKFSGRSRDIVEFLLQHQISARLGIMNAHEEPCYQNQGWKLPNSEESRRSTVILPLFASLRIDEVERVVEILGKFQKTSS